MNVSNKPEDSFRSLGDHALHTMRWTLAADVAEDTYQQKFCQDS